MDIPKCFALFLFGVPLAACVAAQSQPELTVEERASATCRAYGAKPGSPEFVKCMTDTAQGELNRANDRRIECLRERAAEDSRPQGHYVNGIWFSDRSGLADAMRPPC